MSHSPTAERAIDRKIPDEHSMLLRGLRGGIFVAVLCFGLFLLALAQAHTELMFAKTPGMVSTDTLIYIVITLSATGLFLGKAAVYFLKLLKHEH